MPVKLNTEFNYRYQIEGNTPWEKIKQLHGFLEGRKRAAVLENVSELKYQAAVAELEDLKETGAKKHILLTKQAELLETESFRVNEKHAYELNRQEIAILENILEELYEIVEPTRVKHADGTPYTDEEMFELNAANEFTTWCGKEIYAEILATGSPSPAKLRNAMSNPHTWQVLQAAGLIPKEAGMLEGVADPLKIDLRQTFFNAPVVPTILAHQDKVLS
jgi:hypothetical protein